MIREGYRWRYSLDLLITGVHAEKILRPLFDLVEIRLRGAARGGFPSRIENDPFVHDPYLSVL